MCGTWSQSINLRHVHISHRKHHLHCTNILNAVIEIMTKFQRTRVLQCCVALPLRRHSMETLSSLLAICEGNQSATRSNLTELCINSMFHWRSFGVGLNNGLLSNKRQFIAWINRGLVFQACLHQRNYKNIERHTAYTIVSWPNPKQWVIIWYANYRISIQ